MRDLGNEMYGKFVGPLPVKNFLQSFLPIDADLLAQMPDWDEHKAEFEEVLKVDREVAMYGPMVRIMLLIQREITDCVGFH